MAYKRSGKKFNNKIIEYDGFEFHSEKEKRRFLELKMLEKAGEITDLILQPKFTFPLRYVHSHRLGKEITYTADFQYKERTGDIVVEDVKSVPTAKIEAYKIKKALMKHFFGITVLEILEA